MGHLNYNWLHIEWNEHIHDLDREAFEHKQEQDDEDKEGGKGVREPRKPIKPTDKDSIVLDVMDHSL